MHYESYLAIIGQRPEAELSYVWDADADAAKRCAERFGGAALDSLEILLAQRPDAVIVCSENVNHHRHVTQALAAGCDVLCEKPMALSLRDCDDMISAASSLGRILAVAFPCRLSPAWKRVKEIAQSGKVGELLAAKCTNRGQNPGGWFTDPKLSGGGCLIDHTVHVADLLADLTEMTPETVYAQAMSPAGSAVETMALVGMQYDSGFFATIDASWSRPKGFRTWGDLVIEIIGTDGTLSGDLFSQNYWITEAGTGQLKERFWGSSIDAALIEDFLGCVADRRSPAATGEAGRAALAVALSAYQSLYEGQPARLPSG